MENAVLMAERMILGALRDQIFFSLAELNAAIREVLKKLNGKQFQKLDVCRRELFEQVDRPAMRPLPLARYEYGEWIKARVNIDYHLEAARSYYSVPYGLIHKVLDVRLTAATVEIWYEGRRVASHARIYQKGKHQTQEAHRPSSHKRYLEWTPERILAWGRKTGPATEALMGKVMASRKHPEQGFRFGLLVDQEWIYRENRKLAYRLGRAKLRIPEACVEKVDYQVPRKLNKSLLLRLTNTDWVEKLQNVIITGPTGSGKSFLACALAQKACRDGHSALYCRLPRLLQEMALARADGSYGKRLQQLARFKVLILDDWGLTALQDTERRDLLEILEDRHNLSSTIVTSQFPVSQWHDVIGNPTIADAILDRIVHNAHRIELKGESVRKTKAKLD